MTDLLTVSKKLKTIKMHENNGINLFYLSDEDKDVVS